MPWVPSLYARTIVCYSYSKALSLPGERIGWVYVSDSADDGDAVAVAVAGAGRALGYVCAPVLLQRVAARCVGEPSDVAAYAENRAILTEGLSALGYEYVEPDGAFYLWVRALEEDAQAFSDRAKEYELLIVPSDSFGVGGWVRLSYCIARDTIERSMPAFKGFERELRSQIEFVAIARPRFPRFIQVDRFRNLVGALLVIFQRKWLYLRLRWASQKKPALATMRPARVATRPTLGSL